MDDLLKFGSLLMDAVRDMGEFLFETRLHNGFLSATASILRFLRVEIGNVTFGAPEELIDFLDLYADSTVFYVIVSGGIFVVLSLRVIKFIWGIIDSFLPA